MLLLEVQTTAVAASSGLLPSRTGAVPSITFRGATVRWTSTTDVVRPTLLQGLPT